MYWNWKHKHQGQQTKESNNIYRQQTYYPVIKGSQKP